MAYQICNLTSIATKPFLKQYLATHKEGARNNTQMCRNTRFEKQWPNRRSII